MSYGYSEAAKALKLVEAAGLCAIEQRQVAGTKELAPSQYTVSTLLGENSATLGEIRLRLGKRSKSSVSPRITNNSSKNGPRRDQEPERVHQLADAQPDSQSSSGPLSQVQSSSNLIADDIVAAWNEAPGLPRIRNLNDKRRRVLSGRSKDAFFVENFRKAIAKMSESKFCLGKNDRGWKADFDFFLKPGTIEKVIEGKYDNKADAPHRRAQESFI
jgi:hypothetical protein